MELTDLKGLGPKSKEALNAHQIFHVEDLLLAMPKGYDERRIAAHIEPTKAYYEATVTHPPKIFSVRASLKRLTFKADILSHSVTIALFNQTHWYGQLKPGTQIVVQGLYQPSMVALKLQLKENFTPGIQPLYKRKGLSDRQLSKWIQAAFETFRLPEDLPLDLLEIYGLAPRHETIYSAHFPDGFHAVDAFFKRQKVAYLYHREKERFSVPTRQKLQSKKVHTASIDTAIKGLPFALTGAQRSVLDTVLDDFRAPFTQRRLIQGDTGSGKTVVAMLAGLSLIDDGYQVAFMAPTEILANQHFATFNQYFSGFGRAALITGSMDKAALEKTLEAIKNGVISVVFGTHILFSKKVHFKHLGLVVIDEQHRFGVNQRERLIAKGDSVDTISLSATPIPRTLALTLYKDMEVSSLKEVPKGRKDVTTEVLQLKNAKSLDTVITETLKAGSQVFIIAPRIEDDAQLLSVERIEAYYTKRFKEASIGVLHGQQDSPTKHATLERFQAGAIQMLIATTVVEVGIDIQGATLMLIYHAERFGYAQLHQLRGRLGRHGQTGTCYLLYKGSPDMADRLAVLKTVTDGFELSEKDLQTRGFGTLFGTEQTGFNELQNWSYDETLSLIQSLQAYIQAHPEK